MRNSAPIDGTSALAADPGLYDAPDMSPSMLDREPIADFLATAINERGWSVRQFAHRSDGAISEGTAKKMMGAASITLENVDAALRTLGLTWYDLLDATVGGRDTGGMPEEGGPQESADQVSRDRLVQMLAEQSEQHAQLRRLQHDEMVRFKDDTKAFFLRFVKALGVPKAQIERAFEAAARGDEDSSSSSSGGLFADVRSIFKRRLS